MNAQELLNQLNSYPMVVAFDDKSRLEAFNTIAALSELFRNGDASQRQTIAAELGRSAKYVMYEYVRHKAVEARRTGATGAVIDGLIAVVMAGGRSDNKTGGSLMSMLLRSAEKTRMNARELFNSAAKFAINDEQAAHLRDFPSLPLEMRDIARAGIRERKTAEGITYELLNERLLQRTWWDKLRGRRLTRQQMIESVRMLDELNRSEKK